MWLFDLPNAVRDVVDSHGHRLVRDLLLECSWLERHEVLWFLDGSMWRMIFPIAIGAALLVGLVDTLGRLGLSRLRERGHGVTGVLRDLPQTRLWFHLIIWILLLGDARAWLQA